MCAARTGCKKAVPFLFEQGAEVNAQDHVHFFLFPFLLFVVCLFVVCLLFVWCLSLLNLFCLCRKGVLCCIW